MVYRVRPCSVNSSCWAATSAAVVHCISIIFYHMLSGYKMSRSYHRTKQLFKLSACSMDPLLCLCVRICIGQPIGVNCAISQHYNIGIFFGGGFFEGSSVSTANATTARALIILCLLRLFVFGFGLIPNEIGIPIQFW